MVLKKRAVPAGKRRCSSFFKMRITSSELHFPLNSKWAVKAVLCCEFSV